MGSRQHTDTEAGKEVVQDGKDSRLVLQVDPVRRDQADQGDEDDEGGVEPVDVQEPVGGRDGLLGDVCGQAALVSMCVSWIDIGA